MNVNLNSSFTVTNLNPLVLYALYVLQFLLPVIMKRSG